MSIKRFFEWISLKRKLDSRQHRAPHVSEGEIWWASIGENVGYEISGKSQQFSRPVVIYKKLAHQFYFVIPTTSQEKVGSWYVNIVQHGKNMTVCLHQSRTLDYRRLSSKLGELDEIDLKKVKESFKKLYH